MITCIFPWQSFDPHRLRGHLRATTICLVVSMLACPGLYAQPDPSPPASTTRLLFIHHSVGENWLSPDQGGLLAELNRNRYYVFDTNYDWGSVDQDVNDGCNIGSHTDIGHWHNWFLGPNRATYTDAIYRNSWLTEWLENDASMSAPGGENNIILFKSCFISAQTITGSVLDGPRQKGIPNPLAGIGVDVDGSVYTVENIKGLYRDLLDYFTTRQDKLFILITTPPSAPGVADEAMPLLRGINTWLVKGWLASYPHKNVAVFDFGAVLTSNGGDVDTPDIGATTGSHHRLRNGAIEHVLGSSPYLAYGMYDSSSSEWDNHPTPAGSQKATAEFIPLLNVAYNAWHKATDVERLPIAIAPHSCVSWPQPASNAVHISWQSDSYRPKTLMVHDIHGRAISVIDLQGNAASSSSFSLDVRDYHPGMYVYRILVEDGAFSGKFLISR